MDLLRLMCNDYNFRSHFEEFIIGVALDFHVMLSQPNELFQILFKLKQ